MNEYFANIGTVISNEIPPNNVNPLIYLRGSYQNSFYFSRVHPADVKNVIFSLKNKNCSLSVIPVKIIKSIADIISPVLASLINNSFLSCNFPKCLKVARVVPLYKGEDPTDMGNYRPISILPTFSKIFEKVIYIQVYNYIEIHNILHKQQYGFRNKKSTTHAIVNHLSFLYKHLELNHSVVSIYLDFRKAFDCVDHNILLAKLNHYGIRGIANDWFKSYLSNRQQYTRVGDSESNLRHVSRGVPQGSNLGPLLFLLFINDLPNSSNFFQYTLFADDSTLTTTFPKDSNNIAATLNGELEHINSWLGANKIMINADKTKYINYAYRRSTNIDLLKIGCYKGRETFSIKFLGVYLDKHLTFKSHVNYISKKISKSLGILHKLKFYLPLQIMKTLYLTFIYPYLLYGIEAWCAAYQNVTGKIVSLQKKAIRIVRNVPYLEHTAPIFRELRILKVEDLFKMQILVYMYDTIHNNSDDTLLNSLISHADRHAYNTRYSNMYVVPRLLKSTSRHSIEYLGIRAWNALPSYAKDSTNIKQFKFRVRNLYLDEY